MYVTFARLRPVKKARPLFVTRVTFLEQGRFRQAYFLQGRPHRRPCTFTDSYDGDVRRFDERHRQFSVARSQQPRSNPTRGTATENDYVRRITVRVYRATETEPTSELVGFLGRY